MVIIRGAPFNKTRCAGTKCYGGSGNWVPLIKETKEIYRLYSGLNDIFCPYQKKLIKIELNKLVHLDFRVYTVGCSLSYLDCS